MPDSIIIEILTKQDCFLCDEVKDVVTRVLPDYPVRLIMTNIESDSKLFDQFKEKIPVVRINGEESFIYEAHETTLRRKLDKILEKK